MKLPVCCILDALQEAGVPILSSDLPKEADYSLPTLFLGEGKTDPERLYLAEETQLQQLADGVSVVIVSGKVVERSNSLTVNASLSQAYEILCTLWEKMERWKEQLDTIVLHGGTPGDLLRRARQMLENPLFVYGSDLILRGQAGTEDMPEEWNVFDAENGNLDYFTDIQQLLQRHTKEDYQPVILPVRKMPFRSAAIRLVTEWGESFCLTALEQARVFRESDLFLLTFLAPYICRLLQRDEVSADPTGLHAVLRQILEDANANPDEMSRRLSRLGWDGADHYQCFVVMQGSMGNGNRLRRMSVFLESTIPLCCCIPLEDKMVCFFDMDRLGMTQEEFYRKMKFFFRENFLKAGYSRLLQGYRGLRCQYLQAASVLELGLRKTPYIWIHQFDSVALEFLMERSTRDMLPEIVCHEGVNRLRRYDREHGSDYINTLRVYLDENMNVVHAAQKLFIHRSTLLYRLDKIRDIMETVLTDADERLYISLSVRLLEREQENAKGSFPRERI